MLTRRIPFPARLRSGCLAAVAVAVGACAGEATGQGDAQYPWPGETWPTSTPEAEGIDPEAIASLVADLESGEYGLVDAFMLVRHGRVVADHRFEQDYAAIAAQHDTANHQYNYDHTDWHPYLRDTDLHTLQ
ncbi:MAG: hypothetical protein HKO53_02095, partial [Gemmatimonadetes bacterium]|nr:hypothetical protein [Gemmatimonadota bacterium]